MVGIIHNILNNYRYQHLCLCTLLSCYQTYGSVGPVQSCGILHMKNLTFGVCGMVPVLGECILSHVLFFMLIRSCKYFGAMPVMHLNVVIRILYSILCCIGSRCHFFSVHDEFGYLFLL